VIVVYTPRGGHGFYEELGPLTRNGSPDRATVAAVFEKYGMTLLGAAADARLSSACTVARGQRTLTRTIRLRPCEGRTATETSPTVTRSPAWKGGVGEPSVFAAVGRLADHGDGAEPVLIDESTV
jgi:hypothetical protein